MQLVSGFKPFSRRVYRASRRAVKKLAVFPPKHIGDYLDYSIDFARFMQDRETLVSGHVILQGKGMVVESLYASGSILTAFISGGIASRSFYLSFNGVTDQGNSLTQEMILPAYGKNVPEKTSVTFLAFRPDTEPPEQRPPLNAIRIDNRYLLDDNGFFMGI